MQYPDYIKNFCKLRKHEQPNRKASKSYEQETHRKLSANDPETFERMITLIYNQENDIERAMKYIFYLPDQQISRSLTLPNFG